MISICDVAEIFGEAYARAFNIPNITSGFKATRIWPFNPLVFSDDKFLPASVMEVSLPVETENDTPSTASNPLTIPEDIDIQPEESVAELSILTDFSPFPKVSEAPKRRKTNRLKLSVISSTLVKNRLLAQKENQKATRQAYNVRRRILLPSSSSESEISVHYDSSDTNNLSCSDSSTSSQADSASPQVLHVRQYMVVKVYGNKRTFQFFVAEILSGPDEDGDYEVKFMKSSSKIKQGFYFLNDIAGKFYPKQTEFSAFRLIFPLPLSV